MLSQRARNWLSTRTKRLEVCKQIRKNEGTLRAYIHDRLEPRPCTAAAMIRIAEKDGVVLDYADFFGDPMKRPTQLHKELA